MHLKVKRTIWFFIVIATTVCCTVVYFDLAELYYGQRVQTTVAESAYPIFMVPFPSVGVCLRNRIDWHRLNNEASKRFLPANVDNQTLNTFRNFFESLADIKFYTMHRIKALFDPAANINLSLIDNVNILEVMEYLTFPCSQIFNPICMWRYERYNCCDLFTLERTEMGYCYMFNSAVSPTTQEKAKHDPYYPLHNSYSGEGSGLEVDVLLNENKMKPGTKSVNGLYGKSGNKLYPYHNAKAGQNTGLNVRIQMQSKLKSPISKPENSIAVLIKRNNQLSETGYTIIPNTATYFMVRPQITDSDDDLKYLDPIRRNCYFEDENNLSNVATNMSSKCRLNNCLNRCHEEHVIKYCNCTMGLFFLFPNEKVDQCTPANFSCLAKNNDVFSYDKREEEDAYFRATKPGMTCSCLVPCNSVEYFTSLTTIPLRDEETNASSVDIYEVDVHYQSDVIIQYRTSLEFTRIDLIANFGGIFGLCLGASLVSAVELLYYATFGFGLYLYDYNYYTVLKANLKRVTQKFTIGFMNSFKDESDVGHVVAPSPKLKHRHLHKDNRW